MRVCVCSDWNFKPFYLSKKKHQQASNHDLYHKYSLYLFVIIIIIIIINGKKRNCNHRCLETNIHTLAWVPMFQCVKCYLLLEHTHTHPNCIRVFFHFLYWKNTRKIYRFVFIFIYYSSSFFFVDHNSFIICQSVKSWTKKLMIKFIFDLVSFLFSFI